MPWWAHRIPADQLICGYFLPLLYRIFEEQIFIMTEIIIDKKKYVLVPAKDYSALQKKAALKSKAEKVFSLKDARSFSKKLIRKWAAEK